MYNIELQRNRDKEIRVCVKNSIPLRYKTTPYTCTPKAYCIFHVCTVGIGHHLLIIENRIFREEFTGKKCKTAILLYCFHTAGVLQIFMLYNLLGPGISLYIKSKINIKRKPNYEIGWFLN